MEFDDRAEIQLTRTNNYHRRRANPHRGTPEEEKAKDKRVHGSDEYWAIMLNRWPGLNEGDTFDLYLRCLDRLERAPVYQYWNQLDKEKYR